MVLKTRGLTRAIMGSDNRPILFWFRRDLRLSDHPGLTAACATGRPVIPVFIRDPLVDRLGAAPKFRLGLGLEAFEAALQALNSRLILRSGDALSQLQTLIGETGAGDVWWSRAYDPASIARDRAIKADLTDAGIGARSFAGHLLFEPWAVKTKAGGPYRVYSPMWRAVQHVDVAAPVPAVQHIAAPKLWPASERLQAWQLGAEMRRGAPVVRAHVEAGEQAALRRLDRFLDIAIDGYKQLRDRPDIEATSNLSDALSLGEISPRRLWHAALRCEAQGARGAEHFRKELVWREFAYHLMFHTPHLLDSNWRPEWDKFPWRMDPDHPHVIAWKQGRTGMRFVDAAMREMYVTGRMHNRARMITASYLTKHLMTHWKIGMNWFAECLTDWDPAANALGWQWVAGSGPDAAPYFRVFNPESQLEKFDPEGQYVRRWLAEGQVNPPQTAGDFFDAAPRKWALRATDDYPAPIVSTAQGRAAALAAYESHDFRAHVTVAN